MCEILVVFWHHLKIKTPNHYVSTLFSCRIAFIQYFCHWGVIPIVKLYWKTILIKIMCISASFSEDSCNFHCLEIIVMLCWKPGETQRMYLFDYVFNLQFFLLSWRRTQNLKRVCRPLAIPTGPYWLHIGQKGAAKAECQLKWGSYWTS